MSVLITSSDLERRNAQFSYISLFFPGGSSYLRSYRLTNSDRIGHGNRTPLGKGMFIWDHARPIPRLGTSAPQFGGYRLVMPIPFDLDQLFRHGNRNTRGKVRFMRGEATYDPIGYFSV